jgi:hypothetical protein
MLTIPPEPNNWTPVVLLVPGLNRTGRKRERDVLVDGRVSNP